MTDKTFKYVDKDRILPWLKQRRNALLDSADDDMNMLNASALYSKASAFQDVIEGIEAGLWDWQPAE